MEPGSTSLEAYESGARLSDDMTVSFLAFAVALLLAVSSYAATIGVLPSLGFLASIGFVVSGFALWLLT